MNIQMQMRDDLIEMRKTLGLSKRGAAKLGNVNVNSVRRYEYGFGGRSATSKSNIDGYRQILLDEMTRRALQITKAVETARGVG